MATDEKAEFEMEYRRLGGSGLIVSAIGFGCMSLTDVEQAKGLLKEVRKYGVNFFDNAEAYGTTFGVEESIFGEALEQLVAEDPVTFRRSDLVITTKLFSGGFGKNELGLSRKHLMEGINNSLARLRLDYVDLLYCHRPDPLCSIEETVRAMSNIIDQGKAMYWGTSEWTAQQIERAFQTADRYGLNPPVVEQPEYNMFVRENVEKTLLPMYVPPVSLGLTTWSPVYGGFLTSRYVGVTEVEDDARSNTGPFIGGYWRARFIQAIQEHSGKLTALDELAKEKDAEVSQLAIAWVLKNPNVTVCMCGGSKTKYIDSNMRSVDVARRLTAEDMERIEGILENKPEIFVHPLRNLKKTI